MRRYVFMFLVAMFLNLSLSAIAETSVFILTNEDEKYLNSIKGEEIKLAVTAQLNSYTSEDGKRDGLLQPLISLMTTEWGLNIKTVELGWEESLNKLDSKEIDMLGLATLTDKRKSDYYCTESLYNSNISIYVRKNSLITSVLNLNGKTVGVLSNAVFPDRIYNYIADKKKIEFYPDINALITALENKEIDCIISALEIQKELVTHKEIEYGMTVENTTTPQGIFSYNEKYKPLIELINRYLKTEDGLKLLEEIKADRKRCVLELYRSFYSEDIKKLKESGTEFNILNSGMFYPLSYVQDGEYKGLQVQINNVFSELTGVKINMIDVSGEQDPVSELKNSNNISAVTGVYYSTELEQDSAVSLSLPVMADKMGYYVKNNIDDIDSMKVGVTNFGYKYLDRKDISDIFPYIYKTQTELIKDLKKNEIDSAFTGEMNIDYYYTVLNDYSLKRVGDFSIPVMVHILYNSQNKSFNKIMNLSLTINSMINCSEHQIVENTSQNGKFELTRLKDKMSNIQKITILITTFLIIILAVLLMAVIYQLYKFSSYDKQITKMLTTQGNVDMLWGSLKTGRLISKGNYPIFRKWGADDQLIKKHFNVDIFKNEIEFINESGLKFCKMEKNYKFSDNKTDNYIRFYTHKINENEFMVFTIDTTAERYREYELKNIANTDFLSKLLTRRAIDTVLLEKSEGFIENKLFLLMLDIDDFKNVNDSYGHDIGDKVLVSTAQIISDAIGENYAARWGGEEFLVALEVRSAGEAKKIAQKILTRLSRESFEAGDRVRFSLTISCGISEFVKGEKYEDTVKRADRALYKAKAEGKNCIRIVDADTTA